MEDERVSYLRHRGFADCRLVIADEVPRSVFYQNLQLCDSCLHCRRIAVQGHSKCAQNDKLVILNEVKNRKTVELYQY